MERSLGFLFSAVLPGSTRDQAAEPALDQERTEVEWVVFLFKEVASSKFLRNGGRWMGAGFCESMRFY